MVEEDSVHSVRCKLFFKKEKEFKEKGLGMLHLKVGTKINTPIFKLLLSFCKFPIQPVPGDDSKTQMVVRAETNLGNILLNIILSDKMQFVQRGNNVQVRVELITTERDCFA